MIIYKHLQVVRWSGVMVSHLILGAVWVRIEVDTERSLLHELDDTLPKWNIANGLLYQKLNVWSTCELWCTQFLFFFVMCENFPSIVTLEVILRNYIHTKNWNTLLRVLSFIDWLSNHTCAVCSHDISVGSNTYQHFLMSENTAKNIWLM